MLRLAIKREKWIWGNVEEGICQKGIWLWSEHCGVRYRFRTVCEREDCWVCGKEKSWAHYRRYTRGLKYIKEMVENGFVGYFVITCPDEERLEWASQERLREITRYVKRLLKRELGKVKGVMRWHWAGEKNKKWYPHLNILINFGYIEKEELERIKKLIEEKIKVKVVYYHYAKNINKVLHWWRYIARPTFLLQSEVSYEVVKNMKNVIWFGFGKRQEEYEKMTGEEFLEMAYKMFKEGYFQNIKELARFIVTHNRCIFCGEKLKWKKISIKNIKNVKIGNENNDWKSIGWGIFLKKE